MKFNIAESAAHKAAGQISILLLDVDGVLTNGMLFYSANGEELKSFNTLDGHGLKMLRIAGIRTGVISGRKSAALAYRAKELGMDLTYLGREDKVAVLDEIIASQACTASNIAYAGDDFPDLPVLRRVGLSIAVPNAHDEIRHNAMIETSLPGGRGAVREICDFLLKAQGHYAAMLASLD